MSRLDAFREWLDSRTGYRQHRHHLLDEPIPAGTGWWFVTGSVVLFLLALQLVTGVVLSMFYVPSTEFAYDSVRYITDRLPFGAIVRGLHFFGASFIVVAAGIHMMRVVLLGSYKKPREVTWVTGVILLLVIMGFALTGYLLPWDQKAYWATTVTINIARSGVAGEYVAGLMRGGSTLGALTLLRWYATHVFLLPACLIGFTVAHLYLMRRHGISGPMTPVAGEAKPFYPHHALKDTIVNAAVFALLLTLAVKYKAPLDAIADPTDSSYIPRPEWYFLSLFQLLKYFPGPLEPIATLVIPGLTVAGLFALPFLDRGDSRQPATRPLVIAGFAVLGFGIVSLTYLGLRDTPNRAEASSWGPLSIAGAQFVNDQRCVSCHRPGGAANAISDVRLRRGPEWLVSHVRDPQVIAPGLREPPAGGMSDGQARAILSYMRRASAGVTPPDVTPRDREASLILGRFCANCHMIDGEGGSVGPDLTHEGQSRDAKWLKEWIASPESVDPAANMPSFGERLDDAQLTAIAEYLAARK